MSPTDSPDSPDRSASSDDRDDLDRPVLERSQSWRDLHVLLANALRHPDEQFSDAIETGEFEAQLRSLVSTLDVDLAISLSPPLEESSGLTAAYIDLFEGRRQPYAPPAESPYRAWYDRDEGGLMNGPAAAEMRQRYRAIDATVPDAYAADHVALLLEYESLLLEAGDHDAYRSFARSHFEWLPALRRATDAAAAEAPVYRWLVVLLDELFVVLRDRLELSEPTTADVERMLGRIGPDG
ncbi:molecular chaperone TorD family protein [Halapricum desulfuricans]|nr:molecular chaperone TorD family protein [Halapricum desulfuricans]